MSDSSNERLAENLGTLRLRSNITQAQLARAMGLSPASLSERVHGTTEWTLSDLRAAAHALHVTVPELLSDPPSRSDWLDRIHLRVSVTDQMI